MNRCLLNRHKTVVMADASASSPKKNGFMRSAVTDDGPHQEEEEGPDEELPDQGPFSDEEFHLIVEVSG